MKQKAANWAPDAEIRSRLDRWDNIGALQCAADIATRLSRKDIAETAQAILDDLLMTTEYLIKGVKDPERPNLVGHIRERAYALSDVIRIASAPQSSEAPRREKLMAVADDERRGIEESIAEYKQSALVGDTESALTHLCHRLDLQWLEPHDVETIFTQVIADHEIASPDRAFMASALCHNNLTRHNRSIVHQSILLLISDKALSDDIAGRLLLIIMSDMVAWPERWECDKLLPETLRKLIDGDDVAATALRIILIDIIKMRMNPTVEDFIEHGMTDRILGFLKKHIDKTKGDGPKEIVLRGDEAEDFIANEGKHFRSGLEKMQEWKLDGLDIEFSSIRHMKDDDFFRETVNWYRPFSADDCHIPPTPPNRDPELHQRLIEAFAENKEMAESDKYSLLLSFQNTDSKIISSFCDGADENTRIKGESISSADADAQEYIGYSQSAIRLIKDLYRGYKLRRSGFGDTNIFDDITRAIGSESLGIIMPCEETFGDRLVKYGCWAEALIVFSKIAETAEGRSSAVIMRKYAMCLIRNEKDDDAIRALKQADLLDESDPWTKQTLARLMYSKCEYASALFYIQSAKELKRQSRSMIMMEAESEECLGRHEDALKIWEKMTYEDEDDAEAQTGAARCLLVLGRRHEAGDAMKHVDAEEGGEDAKIIRALFAIIDGQTSLGIEALRDVVEEKEDEDDLAEAMTRIIMDCKNILMKFGMTEIDVRLLANIASAHYTNTSADESEDN